MIVCVSRCWVRRYQRWLFLMITVISTLALRASNLTTTVDAPVIAISYSNCWIKQFQSWYLVIQSTRSLVLWCYHCDCGRQTNEFCILVGTCELAPGTPELRVYLIDYLCIIDGVVGGSVYRPVWYCCSHHIGWRGLEKWLVDRVLRLLVSAQLVGSVREILVASTEGWILLRMV